MAVLVGIHVGVAIDELPERAKATGPQCLQLVPQVLGLAGDGGRGERQTRRFGVSHAQLVDRFGARGAVVLYVLRFIDNEHIAVTRRQLPCQVVARDNDRAQLVFDVLASLDDRDGRVLGPPLG